MASLRFSPETLRGIRNFGADLASPSARAGGMLTGAPQQSLPNIFARNVGTLLGRDMRTPQEKLGALVAQGTQTPEQRMAIAAEYAKFDPIRGMQLMEAERRAQKELALEKQENELERQKKERIQNFRTSLISRSNALGESEERASTIADAPVEMLSEIRKEILSDEREAALKNTGRKGRFAIGRAAGLSEEQIKQYSGLDDEQFSAVISAQEADDVMMKDSQGNLGVYRVNKFSMINIEDPETGVNKWIDPKKVGLLQAPKETKTLNQANELSAELTKAGVTSFVDLTEQARMANSTLATNQEGRKLLDEGVITGSILAAPVSELLLIAKALGAEGDSIENAENAQLFMATRVREIGNAIQMFGSGTGLSDKDAALAAAAAGAEMKMTAENIRELLRIGDEAARKKLAIHKQVYDNYAEEATTASLAAFKVEPFTSSSEVSLNPTAASFIPK